MVAGGRQRRALESGILERVYLDDVPGECELGARCLSLPAIVFEVAGEESHVVPGADGVLQDRKIVSTGDFEEQQVCHAMRAAL